MSRKIKGRFLSLLKPVRCCLCESTPNGNICCGDVCRMPSGLHPARDVARERMGGVANPNSVAQSGHAWDIRLREWAAEGEEIHASSKQRSKQHEDPQSEQ